MHGKIPQSFIKYQLAHYQQIGSRRSIKRWASGLIEQLFLIVHGQWTLQNTIKNERDSRGLKAEERNEIEDAISFELSNRRLESPTLSATEAGSLFAMQGIEQRYWLASIRATRGSTLPTNHQQPMTTTPP
jgi:hypothetical protein